MAGVLRAWTKIAEKQPLLTLALTNGTLGGVGDVLAQAIESHNTKKPFRWSYHRTLRFVAWGALCAPIFHKWYLFLNRKFPLPVAQQQQQKQLSTTLNTAFMTAVAKRVAADQCIYAPLGIAGFFIAMNFMEGRDWTSAKARLREYYRPTLIANYAVWPAVQVINFGFVPPIYRVPFSSVVSIFWNTFISWANAQSADAIDIPLESPHTHVEPQHRQPIENKV
ncbi:hypothetical protein COEREDRAFT_42576 [Coemansia reversa NRRL 1564]|uniref:Uncharacterized protein n=1 Tax=Coemansia reversa (strain ATCC 12441 / NRRL 1564) TaxID=763665 RepID=A0A2G5BCM3_COERN|nr:hypothetical protein COEREDRAFT_42576 [Coemansia reversa NRRL 1564]|eukprot:PIA16467.1 hypothetical protein COEREDRAFT_42576 [Coemansia reversa NRRL 1564]